MNRKQLTILIVVGIALGAIGLWAYKKNQAPYQESTRRMGEKLVPNFPVNDVAQISIKQRATELNLAKKDDIWTVKERSHYPANFSTISELVRKVSDLKVAKPVRVGPSRLPQLELVPPDKGPGTQVEFRDQKGKAIQVLLLGAKHMKDAGGAGAESPFGGGSGSFPDGRYVMLGSDIQTVALINDALTSTDPKPEDWINKDWFKVEKLKSITVTSTNATNNWKLSRESETNDWKLADVKTGEQVDSTKLSSVTSALSSPYFSDVATNTPEQAGLNKPAVTARLETVDGFTYEVKAANKAGDDYYMQVLVSANLPKERTPGKDEKKEDKDKLDKEFKESVGKLQEKLKTEKAYEKWVYVVSKWTIDPILKERKDLLQEKKEEPKPATAGSTTNSPAVSISPAPSATAEKK